MIISNELFQTLCIMDNDTSKYIANTLKLKANDMVFTGLPLTDSFNNGYLKAIELVIKLLLCSMDSKEGILKQINETDLSEYLHYSCKSCFNKGFIRAIDQFNLEMDIVNDIKL